MRATVIILGFIVYSLAIFWISDFVILLAMLIAECLTLLFAYQSVRWRRLWQILIFLSFIFACNLLYCDVVSAIMITLRLALSLSAVAILLQGLSLQEIGQGITSLLSPFKKSADLQLSIMIALSVLPSLFTEAKAIEQTLKTRGAGWKTLLRQPSVYIVAYLENVFARTAAIEQSLRLKGY